MNFSDFINVYAHSPAMWFSTIIAFTLWPLTFIAFFKMRKATYTLNKVAFIIMLCLSIFIVGIGFWGYTFSMTLTQQSLAELDEIYRDEALALGKKDALLNLYFSIFVVLPTFLLFIFYKLKRKP